MLHKAIRFALMSLCGMLLVTGARAQTTEEAARELVKAMKVEEQYKQMASSMATQLRPVLQSVSARVPEEKRVAYMALANKVVDNMTNADPKEMIDATVKVYAKYYTEDELKGLSEFYKTPLGQKMMENMPKITGELMGLTMQLNQAQTGKIMEELVKEFPELNAPPPAATPAPAGGEPQK
jgi:uncharacterized protein